MNLSASDQVDIQLSGTLLKAEYGKLTEAGGADRSGNLPPKCSREAGGLCCDLFAKDHPDHARQQCALQRRLLHAKCQHCQSEFLTTVDGAIAWNASFGTQTLCGRNLTDEFYADWSGYSSGLVFVSAPRSADLMFTRKF